MSALVSILSLAIWAFSWLIVARALLSWLPLRSGTVSYRAYSFLYDVTEPYLQLFRRLLKPLRAGATAIDLSPFIGLAVLYFALRLLALV